MIRFIRKRLSRSILIVLAVCVALVIGAVDYLRVSREIKDRIEMITLFGKEFAASIYTGIKYPMFTGDSDGVKKQLLDIREKTKDDVEVFICDSEQEIIFATHEDKIKTNVRDSIYNKAAVQTLNEALKTGVDPQKAFEEEVLGKRYLVTIQSVLNQAACFRCHDSSRKVLGSIVVKMSTDRIYSTIISNRNRSIIISILGIGLIILLTYTMLTRLVSRPIESLADKAKKFAEGDMSISVDVKTEDEVGILGNSFNYMVKRLSSVSKEMEEEVVRRTALLREKTILLEQANRELREVDRLKSIFLANMSHELRTPMNSIIGYTELLLDGVDGLINEEQAKDLHKVSSNARYLLQLINDILDMSKIESGKIELDIKALDLKNIIESATATFGPAITKKGLALTLNLDEKVSRIYGDEERVRQILINLLSNAVKFTEKGGITINTRISERGVKLGESPLFVEVCIEDTGIGIKDEDMGKLFGKFSQLDISTVRRFEGTGLGLSIARGLVVLQKGAIWAASKYGAGSKFCFTLPMKKEIFEKPVEPVIELKMAEGLAEYFHRPVEVFLKEAQYAGKPIRCWEYIHCGQTTCPAYGSKEHRCWLIFGTHCKGTKVASYPEKVDFCKGCEIIERLILESDEYMEIKTTEAIEPEKKAAKKVVLSIDDNPESIDIIRKYLGEDYSVVGILSGEEAVNKAKEIRPIAITLDIMMPTKDGWQVLQELKSAPETQDIPVIVLSIVDEKQLGFSLGAAEYMVKPVEKSALLRKLKHLEKITKIKKVLVVEDEPDTAALLGNVLSEGGYHVITAYTSEDAIKSVRDSLPDLIVLNLTMLEVNGFDVIEYIKTEAKVRDVPLILLTHKDLTEEEINKLNGKIQGILNKGALNKEGLLKELRNTISKMQ